MRIIHSRARRTILVLSALYLTMHTSQWGKKVFALGNLLFFLIFISPLVLQAGDYRSDAEALSGKDGLKPYKNAIEFFLKSLD